MGRRQFHGLVAGAVAVVALGADARHGLLRAVDVEPEVVDGVLQMTVEPTAGPVTLAQELTGSTFTLAGLTWASGTEGVGAVEVRSRTAGAWGPWTSLAVDEDMPDPDPSAGFRPGTDPYIADGADAIEARVRPLPGRPLPEDLRLDLVSEEPLPADVDAVATTTDLPEAAGASGGVAPGGLSTGAPTLLGGLEAAAPRPAIRTRAQWGADETLRQNYGQPIVYGSVLGGFVHHTAGVNTYAAADVPGILRSIYRYHVVSRSFWDIGYNILVDRFGTLWEGAYGGLDRAVVAAHTQHYNSSSFGISAIGTYTSKTTEGVLRSALGQAIAWKFSVHDVPAGTGTAQYSGANASPKPRISGHRDARATECPGGSLYAHLPALRTDVTQRMKVGSTLRMSGPAVVVRGARTTLSVTWTTGSTPLTGKVNLQRRAGGSWEHVRQFAVTNGSGSTVITPGADNQYRLRASSCTRSDIDLSDPRGTSNTVAIAVQAPPAIGVRLSGPASVVRGAATTLTISWHVAGGPVSGRVNLQRRAGGSWEHVRQIVITGGRATTVITPGASNSYRLRASSATSPAGTPTADPQGTSNTYSVTVR